MAIYYYDDPNGKYASTDGTRKFTKVSGKAAYDFLKTPEGKTKRFMKVTDSEDGGEDVFVELQPKDIPEYRKAERHEQHIRDMMNELGISVIPFSAIDGGEEDSDDDFFASFEDTIVDDSINIAEDLCKKEELATLRKALDSLTPSEYRLIFDLYLSNSPMTVPEIAELRGQTHQSIYKLKTRILSKLKKYF